MSESTQHVLSRVRPPRVQITYDVQIGDAFQKKELPFIVGILADLSGTPEVPLRRLKDRKFVEIDRDNFDSVLESATPRVSMHVPNVLQDGAKPLSVVLTFRELADFRPDRIVLQVDVLKKLFAARNNLRDLLARLDGNDDLDALLTQVMTNSDDATKLRAELQPPSPDAKPPVVAAPAPPAAG